MDFTINLTNEERQELEDYVGFRVESDVDLKEAFEELMMIAKRDNWFCYIHNRK